MTLSFSLQRTASVARKEVLHILRDRQTLFMTMFFPIVELFMLGYAIDTNVRNIPTVVFDQARTQESRTLLRRFENSNAFVVVGKVDSEHAMTDALVGGQASVGIRIPENYSRRLLAGDTAEVQVEVDGTTSSVAGEALNGSNGLTLSESLERTLGDRPLPIDSRPRILFNPDTRSANFFIPGLLVVLCQMMAVMLTSNAIVREKENGTLEQLFMTPVRWRTRPRQDDSVSGADFHRDVHDRAGDARHLLRADQGPVRDAVDPRLAVSADEVGLGPLGLDARVEARRRHANVDGDGNAVHLPIGLRVSARLDAAGFQVRRLHPADDLADRRRPARDPLRRRLATSLAARRGPYRHGRGGAGDQHFDVSQAVEVSIDSTQPRVVVQAFVVREVVLVAFKDDRSSRCEACAGPLDSPVRVG